MRPGLSVTLRNGRGSRAASIGPAGRCRPARPRPAPHAPDGDVPAPSAAPLWPPRSQGWRRIRPAGPGRPRAFRRVAPPLGALVGSAGFAPWARALPSASREYKLDPFKRGSAGGGTTTSPSPLDRPGDLGTLIPGAAQAPARAHAGTLPDCLWHCRHSAVITTAWATDLDPVSWAAGVISGGHQGAENTGPPDPAQLGGDRGSFFTGLELAKPVESKSPPTRRPPDGSRAGCPVRAGD